MRVDYATDHDSAAQGVVAAEFNIDLKKKAKLVTILSSGLYRDKITSMVRELASNAYDSHVMKGNLEVPFDVTVPTWEKPEFVIRDYGVGLTPEEAAETIFSYLGSSKDDSDDFIGGWGLGSKSPYAYTNEFEVTLYHGGKFWEYNCWQNKIGIPEHAVFNEGETDEPNGVKVRVPVKTSDVFSFQSTCTKYLNETNFNVRVTNPGCISLHRKKKLYEFEQDGFKFALSDHLSEGRLLVVYGGFVYRIDELAGLEGETKNLLEQVRASSKYSILVGVNVGDCDFSVSRESLAGSEKTLTYLNRAIKAFIKHIKDAAFQYYNEVLTGIEKNIEAAKTAGGKLDFSKIQQHNVSYLNQHPVFSYLSYSNFVQKIASGDAKQELSKGLSASSGVWSFKLDVEMHKCKLSNGKSWETESDLKQIHIRHKKNGEEAYSVRGASLDYQINILAPMRNQLVLVWSANRVLAKYLDMHTHPPGKLLLVTCPTKAEAETIFATIGFVGVEVHAIEEYFDALTPEVIRKKREKIQRDGPVFLQDNISGTRYTFDPDEDYYYITEQELTQFRGYYGSVCHYLYHHEDTILFVASPTFIKKYGNGKLDNVHPYSELKINLEPLRQRIQRGADRQEVVRAMDSCNEDHYFGSSTSPEYKKRVGLLLNTFGYKVTPELEEVLNARCSPVGSTADAASYSGLLKWANITITPKSVGKAVDPILAVQKTIKETDLRFLKWNDILSAGRDVSYLVECVLANQPEEKEVANG